MSAKIPFLLLAATAPAMVFAEEPAPATPDADWFGVPATEQSALAAEQSAPAAEAARAIAERMAFVFDQATADAAAADIAPLVPQLAAQGGEETFWARMHMAYADCYGSDSLRSVMAPLLPPADTAQNPAFSKSLPLLMDVWRTLEDLTSTLGQVSDKEGADKAAEAINLFANHLDECMQNGNSVPSPQGNRIDLVIFFYSGEYQRSGALYKAWGDLQDRSVDYYGSQALAEAMENLSAAMENLDQPADPYAIGKMCKICGQLENELRQWLALAATVKDQASADAAAAGLAACVERMRSAAAPLGSGYEKDLGHVSPMFLFLSLAADRVALRFARLDYFGSSALKGSM